MTEEKVAREVKIQTALLACRILTDAADWREAAADAARISEWEQDQRDRMTGPKLLRLLTLREAQREGLAEGAPQGAERCCIWQIGDRIAAVWEKRARFGGTGFWDFGCWNWRTDSHLVALRMVQAEGARA